MPSFSTVTAGVSTVSADHINQFADDLNGNGNIPVSLTGINDANAYALSVRNSDGTNGRTFRALDSSGTARLVVDGNGPRVDPTGAGTLGTITTDTIASTLTNKTLSSGTKIVLGSDAAGDLYFRNSSGELARLAVGSSGHGLESSGGLPVWREKAQQAYSVFVPAGAFELSTAAFPQPDKYTSTNWTRRVLRYSNSSEEYADATLAIPTGAPVGAITAYVHWTQSTGSSASVTWRVAHLSRAGGEALDTAPASTVSVTSSGSSVAGRLQISSAALSSISGYAAGEQVDLRLTRSTGGVAHDAYFIGLRLEFRA